MCRWLAARFLCDPLAMLGGCPDGVEGVEIRNPLGWVAAPLMDKEGDIALTRYRPEVAPVDIVKNDIEAG